MPSRSPARSGSRTSRQRGVRDVGCEACCQAAGTESVRRRRPANRSGQPARESSGERLHCVERLGRAAPGGHDEASMPAPSQAAMSSSDCAGAAHRDLEGGVEPARPRALWPRIVATEAAAVSGVCAHADPAVAAGARPVAGRRADSPPMWMGMGCWSGLGSKATSAKGKWGPSWATVSSVHRRRQTAMASSSRAPRWRDRRRAPATRPGASRRRRRWRSRPPESQSRVAKARAVMKGCREAQGDRRRSRAGCGVVRAATKDSIAAGSKSLVVGRHRRVLGPGVGRAGHGQGEAPGARAARRTRSPGRRPARPPRPTSSDACAPKVTANFMRHPLDTAANAIGPPAPCRTGPDTAVMIRSCTSEDGRPP